MDDEFMDYYTYMNVYNSNINDATDDWKQQYICSAFTGKRKKTIKSRIRLY